MRINTLHFRTLLILYIIPVLAVFTSIHDTHAVMHTVAGTVTQVSDGDSIQIVTPEQAKLKVRLHGIDAPETA
jgi:endonuclease YncB( thermonuclease family)